MKKIITFQIVFLITISVFANISCDSFPVIVKRISPNIGNSFSEAANQIKIIVTCCHCRIPNIQEPLLVIDGVVFEYNELSRINPNDIEYINIIKGEVAIAIYGNRASDGVIVIATKSSRLRKFIVKDFLDGSFIAGATLSFISVDKKDTVMAAANDSGIVITDKLKIGHEYDITTSAIGYKTLSENFKNNIRSEKEILLERVDKTLGEVIIVPGVIISCDFKGAKTSKINSNMKTIYSEHEINSFKVFPNPVKSGTTINIEWKQSEEGEYILLLFNQAGQLIFNKAMWIDNEARVLNIEVPNVAAGAYFLRMTNKNSGKSLTEKIIIQ